MNKKEIVMVRTRNKISQVELAKILNCSDGHISQLECDAYPAVLDANEIVALIKYDSKFNLEEYLGIKILRSEPDSKKVEALERLAKEVIHDNYELRLQAYMND